ncbi:MAG: biotin--[acetyl-CoA-carboxylase] ligase [Methanotrichaceae archaeon]|nr:biotin--[acetyl-CoA-carboxylase] ligase [Methanotrichaceae archaeon]
MGDHKILDHLTSGSWISGEQIASRLGISRAAVWKQIQGLRARGYEIDSSTNRGYRLISSPELLDPEWILHRLRTDIIGRDLRFFSVVRSTNDTAKSIASACGDGTVVLAETQTDGRGRLSRFWASPRGGVWMSLVLKPQITLAKVYWINMAISVAISRSLLELYGLETGIKWPNDLLINEKKVCGILTEINAEMDKLEYAVVGLGINANVEVSIFPDQWNATSLSFELGYDVSRNELVQQLINEIDFVYTRMDTKELYREWCQKSSTLGKYVRVYTSLGNLEGKAIALLEDGALCLRSREGDMRVLAGDCIHLRTLFDIGNKEVPF